jgi:hypothetical protein
MELEEDWTTDQMMDAARQRVQDIEAVMRAIYEEMAKAQSS